MGLGVSIFPQSIDASSCRPRSVSEKYIWRLSAVPSSRLTNSFSSTERSTFDMFEGVSPSRSLNSPQESLPASRDCTGSCLRSGRFRTAAPDSLRTGARPRCRSRILQSLSILRLFCERPACRSADTFSAFDTLSAGRLPEARLPVVKSLRRGRSGSADSGDSVGSGVRRS